MAEDQMSTDADWLLKAMVVIAAADGRLDTREVGLIQQVYEKQTGRRLTAVDIAKAAQANAEGDVLAQFAAASAVLDDPITGFPGRNARSSRISPWRSRSRKSISARSWKTSPCRSKARKTNRALARRGVKRLVSRRRREARRFPFQRP
jgi:hypothetical protein